MDQVSKGGSGVGDRIQCQPPHMLSNQPPGDRDRVRTFQILLWA